MELSSALDVCLVLMKEEGSWVYLLIAGAVLLIIQAVIASKFEAIAFEKGYDSSIHSRAMCFWFGLVGYLYVIALPDRKSSTDVLDRKNSANVPAQKNCPRCNQPMSANSNLCSACRSELYRPS